MYRCIQRGKLAMTLYPTFRTVQLNSTSNNIRTFRKTLQVIEMVTITFMQICILQTDITFYLRCHQVCCSRKFARSFNLSAISFSCTAFLPNMFSSLTTYINETKEMTTETATSTPQQLYLWVAGLVNITFTRRLRAALITFVLFFWSVCVSHVARILKLQIVEM